MKAQRIRIGIVLIAGLLFFAYIRNPVSPVEVEKWTEVSAGSMVGYLAAQSDSRSGKYEIRAYGLLAVPMEYDKLLMDRYGIKFRRMGCVVSYYELGYTGSYWKVMNKDLRNKYGRDVLDEAYRDAKELRYRRAVEQHQQGRAKF
jgi:hypothetical protein